MYSVLVLFLCIHPIIAIDEYIRSHCPIPYNCVVCVCMLQMKETTIDNKFKEETANAFKFKIKDVVDMVATHAFVVT